MPFLSIMHKSEPRESQFMRKALKVAALLSATALLVVSCGDKEKHIGQFIDSPVQGLRYSTNSQDGTTNVSGEFVYRRREKVHFYIGNYEIGSSDVRSKITPLDLANTESYTDYRVINTARLLQSLDSDSSTVGIQISSQAAAESGRLTGVDLSVSPDEFTADTRVTDFLSAAGAAGLIDETTAITALKSGVANSSDGPSQFTVTPTAAPTQVTAKTYDQTISLGGSIDSTSSVTSYKWTVDSILPDDTGLEWNIPDSTIQDALLIVQGSSNGSAIISRNVIITLKLLVKTDDGKQGWSKVSVTVCATAGC